MEKLAKKLTAAARKRVAPGNFVFPQQRRYPIHDLSHARNALARVAQHGTPAEQSAVRRAVYGKYPALKERKKESLVKQASLVVDSGLAGSVGGLMSGYYAGGSSSETTAGGLSSKGSKTRNSATAKNISRVTAPAGALGGLAVGHAYKKDVSRFLSKHLSSDPAMTPLYEGVVPFAAGTAGGYLAGAATGALMSLRGRKK